ncbi:MAG TPA: NAD(P)-dependent oxidoreductase [bacterium]|nr:NAD(P)-dependent oxidoreductase [bacterium]
MKRQKIVVAQNLCLSEQQRERLRKLGQAVFYDDFPDTVEEWLKRCQDADIILCGKFGAKQAIYNLENKFFSFPFVGYGWMDIQKCKEKNINVAISPGCNKNAVAEWLIGFMINLLRQQCLFINIERKKATYTGGGLATVGLKNKKVTILGKGNVGMKVGQICDALDMEVEYFLRGDDLFEKTKEADVVFNCLSHNPSTDKLLDKKFFDNLKRGAYFISATSDDVFDSDAMLESINYGHLAGAGIDAGSIQVGDYDNPYYQKLLGNNKVLVTPHVAYNTDVTNLVCNDMMIDNVEAWVKGEPINLVTE